MNDAEGLKELRRTCKLSQGEMAARLGLSLRAYQDIETGASPYRKLHRLAVERLALELAVEDGNAKILPEDLQRLAFRAGQEAIREMIERGEFKPYRSEAS
jgi:DNA-binding XRE family transcriptional regulator